MSSVCVTVVDDSLADSLFEPPKYHLVDDSYGDVVRSYSCEQFDLLWGSTKSINHL